MELIRTDLGIAVARPGADPLPIRCLIGIGRNYAEHAKEQGAEVPDHPLVFFKNPASVCLSGDEIRIPAICQQQEQVDYEGELAIVIGRSCLDVSELSAGLYRDGYILGYCIANDVSARWWQKEGSGGQFCRGKSFDTFCPLGPKVTPAMEVLNVQSLRLETRLNGEVVQSASTADMLFRVHTLVAELSRGMTLLPGTVILTGTPAGVGMSRKPLRFLRQGDVVEVSIEGLGSIRNTVRVD